MEYEFDQNKQDLQDSQDQVSQLKEQARDKDQVIDYVSQEVTKIKTMQEEERQEFQEKEELILSQTTQI